MDENYLNKQKKVGRRLAMIIDRILVIVYWMNLCLDIEFIMFFREKNLKYRKIILLINFIFAPNFSYRFLPNFKKLCDFNKLQITFSWKRFPAT